MGVDRYWEQQDELRACPAKLAAAEARIAELEAELRRHGVGDDTWKTARSIAEAELQRWYDTDRVTIDEASSAIATRICRLFAGAPSPLSAEVRKTIDLIISHQDQRGAWVQAAAMRTLLSLADRAAMAAPLPPEARSIIAAYRDVLASAPLHGVAVERRQWIAAQIKRCNAVLGTGPVLGT